MKELYPPGFQVVQLLQLSWAPFPSESLEHQKREKTEEEEERVLKMDSFGEVEEI